MNHASLKSLVVPVLPAAGSVKPSAARARAGARVDDVGQHRRHQERRRVADRARRRSCALRTARWPSRSSTRRISIGCGTRPWLANAAYAAVIDCSVTSPDPSASDGTLGTSPTPIVFAYCTVLRDADLLQQPHGGAVARRAQRRAQGHRVGGRVFVFRRPRALQRGDRIVELIDDGRRRIAGLERGGVDERLERRAGLAVRLDGAVEVALVEVAAADHRAHVAGRRIERDERGLQRLGGRRRRRAASAAAARRACQRLRRSSIAFSDSATAASAAFCIGMSIVE